MCGVGQRGKALPVLGGMRAHQALVPCGTMHLLDAGPRSFVSIFLFLAPFFPDWEMHNFGIIDLHVLKYLK